MIQLGTKAETIKSLYGKLKMATVLPAYFFSVADWENRRELILKKYNELLWSEEIIVRSSSLSEDTNKTSEAGKYDSVLGVCGEDNFSKAVDHVISSYDDDNPRNQVLIQPMLQNVKMCGVAFTLDPNTLGNYYVINYDESGSTSGITAGESNNKLYYRAKFMNESDADSENKEMNRLILALQELEALFSQNNLDVEFAYTKDGELYILQVRALCVKSQNCDEKMQRDVLKRIFKYIEGQQAAIPFLCGRRAIYSVMTDWNPAEMIGIRPKTLALSLYREIITDSVWAYQRDNYGYRNLRSFPLMLDFAGLPYIDTRVSFNSFVPAELDQKISEKLVDYYLDRLAENPLKHDKAEFEIVYSCYTLDLPERILTLKEYGFGNDEIEQILNALRNVTNNIIDHESGLWKKDYKKIEKLNQRYNTIMESSMSEVGKIYWLLEDCKRYGTLPFAGLARAAFIAVQILKSLVSCEIISSEDYEAFMNGVNTVSSSMNADYVNLSKSAFLAKYGHLRPGTYDITSARYDEEPDLYFKWDRLGMEESNISRDIFRLSLNQMEKLKGKLEENGLKADILELLDFIKKVIEGREYGKFAFTRNLSMALKLIGEIGERVGISREECAYMDIKVIYDMYKSPNDIQACFQESIERGKQKYEIAKSLVMPPVIVEPKDILEFYYPDSEPNYITTGKALGEICLLDGIDEAEHIDGKIVMIASADPGFDWIFSHGISGFITMYGGANSHMAIRAGELGIPAVVGIGEKLYNTYQSGSIIEINCLEKTIKILR